MTMEKAYVELDKEDVGYLTYDDMANKFIALGATLSKDDLVSLAGDIDTDNDKKISKVLVCTCVFVSRAAAAALDSLHVIVV